MNAIRITQKLESDTLYLPQLRPFVGREVEIIVLETSPAGGQAVAGKADANWVSPLAGSVLEYHDPFEPAASPEEWEANQ
jgi:hypothetical protein